MKNFIIKRPFFSFGLAVFFYTAIAAAFVQLVLLPHIFPSWHAGNGLLYGGDSARFHQLAADMAVRIRESGWEAWALRPEGQAPAGIAAVLYYLVTPAPWVMIPLQSLLHAASAVILAWIVNQFVSGCRWAALAAVPLAFYPSSLLWITQLHKDSYSIFGGLLMLAGWILLHKFSMGSTRRRSIMPGAAAVVSGMLCIWLVRPYLVQVAQISSFALFLPGAALAWLALIRKRALAGRVLGYSVLGLVLILFMTPFDAYNPAAEVRAMIDRWFGPEVVSTGSSIPDPFTWEYVGWLPDGLESMVREFARSREGYTQGYPDAGSNIDVDVSFHSVPDILAYLPRALQIAFLAPFPADWFQEGTLAANTVMRRVSAFEMSVVYASLIFLMYGIWRWKKQFSLWIVLGWSTANMLAQSLVVANVGTLYRFRYGFLMTIVGLGAASAVQLYLDRVKGPGQGVSPANEAGLAVEERVVLNADAGT